MERPSRLRQQPPGESESRTGAGLRLQRPDCPLLPRSVPTPQSTRDSGVPAPSVHRRKLWSGAGSQVQPGSQPLLFLPHPESLEGKKRWAQTGKGRWGSRQGGLVAASNWLFHCPHLQRTSHAEAMTRCLDIYGGGAPRAELPLTSPIIG